MVHFSTVRFGAGLEPHTLLLTVLLVVLLASCTVTLTLDPEGELERSGAMTAQLCC